VIEINDQGGSIQIGEIDNYYGELWVVEFENKYYWSIEDWKNSLWEEIPEDLYRRLVQFEALRPKNSDTKKGGEIGTETAPD